MYRRTRRVIQHQDVVIFIQDHITQGGHLLQLRRHDLFFTFGNTHRWDTYFVTGFELILRLHAFFVNPHLALTQDAVNHAFWYPFQLGAQKVIDTLPRFIIGDSNHFYGWSLCFHGWRF